MTGREQLERARAIYGEKEERLLFLLRFNYDMRAVVGGCRGRVRRCAQLLRGLRAERAAGMGGERRVS
jgi:hypothetical protein